MALKRSFLIIQQIFFVFFSLQFIKDAFFKWDGFSYYMQFSEFLPNLSLALILWSIVGVLFSTCLWLIIYLLSRAIPKSIVSIQVEHILFYLVFVFLALFIKWGFFHEVSISDMFGFSRAVTLISGGILFLFIAGLTYKHTGMILNEFYSRIKVLYYIFGFCVIISIAFSGITLFSQSYLTQITHNNVSSGHNRPNIILVSWDTLTAQNMSLHGYPRPTTPFITEWAEDAIVFNKAYSSSNWTPPTSMTLMTGQHPWTHKVWYAAIFNPIENYKNSLPALLKDNGFATYAFVQNYQCHPDVLGFGNDFLVKDKFHKFWSIKNGWNWHLNYVKFFIHEITNNEMVAIWVSSHPVFLDLLSILVSDSSKNITPAEKVYDRFLEFIPNNTKQPYFAWLHVFPPHNDYLPPAPYMGAFGDAHKYNSSKTQGSLNVTNKDYLPDRQADVDILEKRYDEFILYSDQKFKNFLADLSKKIDLSNTIIIFTSDHGESFSHGYQGHTGPYLYEQLVHVPLIFKIPEKFKANRINIPVAQIDIAPTILELVDIPVPDWMEGRSLVPFLKGNDVDTQPVFSMQLISNSVFGNDPISSGTVAVWDGDYKLIHNLKDSNSILFNLRNDPDERQDITDENPELTRELENLIRIKIALANKNHIQ